MLLGGRGGGKFRGLSLAQNNTNRDNRPDGLVGIEIDKFRAAAVVTITRRTTLEKGNCTRVSVDILNFNKFWKTRDNFLPGLMNIPFHGCFTASSATTPSAF
jgi:hypothetical protein